VKLFSLRSLPTTSHPPLPGPGSSTRIFGVESPWLYPVLPRDLVPLTKEVFFNTFGSRAFVFLRNHKLGQFLSRRTPGFFSFHGGAFFTF